MECNQHAQKCVHSLEYADTVKMCYLEEKQIDAQGALGSGPEKQQRHVQHVPVGLHAHQQARARIAATDTVSEKNHEK